MQVHTRILDQWNNSYIIVFTNHKDNTFDELQSKASDLVFLWLLLLEEYGVTFEYLSGKIQKIMALLRILYPVLILRA
jgi:hypothetical protein